MGELHSIAEAASASDKRVAQNKGILIEQYANDGSEQAIQIARAIERQHPPKSKRSPETLAENRIIGAETLAKVIAFRSRK